MSTHKNIDKICVVVLILSLIITVLFMFGRSLGLEPLVDEDAERSEGSAYFTANDLDGQWDSSNPTAVIKLNGDSAKVSGAGAYAYDGGVVITGYGWYVLSGELTDGSITIDAHASSKVWLLFDGVTIHRSDSACILVEQAEKVFLTLAEGSENVLTSGESYSQEAIESGIDAAIFARDDLTINGSGSLRVTSAYRHGIAANDELVITGGTISVTGQTDAIHVNDSLCFCNAALTLSAAEDEGIDVDGEGGFFYMESGSIDLESADDGIHAEGDVMIAGGTLTISAGDDGIHADSAIYVSGGTLAINKCYEGLEAIVIELSGGDTLIYPSDDGLNANGGSSGGMGGPDDMGDMPGGMDAMEQDEAQSSDEETYVRISGGSLTIINANGIDADGIDSNGSLYITGGTVRVSLANNSNNSALDYGSENNGVCEVSGGTVIAAGNYSMAEQFDSSSAQASVLYTLSAGAEAGTTVAVEDLDGNALISYEVPLSFSSVNISCPELEVGETYLIVIGDAVEEITLSEISSSFGDAASGGFGGTFTMGGGLQAREDFAPADDMPGGAPGGMGGGPDGGPGGDFGGGPDGGPDGAPDGGPGGGPEGGPGGSQPPAAGDMTPPEAEDFSGEPPEMPDFTGEVPDFAGEMSDAAGEMPGGAGGMPGMPDEGSFGDTAPEAEQTTETETASAQEPSLDSGQWLWVGISALVLALGLVFAGLYKRR